MFNKQNEPDFTGYFGRSFGHARAGWIIIRLYGTAEALLQQPHNVVMANRRRKTSAAVRVNHYPGPLNKPIHMDKPVI